MSNQPNIQDWESGSTPLDPQDVEGINQIYETLFGQHDGLLREREQSVVLTLLPNMAREQSVTFRRQEEPLESPDKLQKEVSELRICIDPICFEQSREVTSQQSHKKHKIISNKQLLRDLTVLKSNHIFKLSSPERVKNILNSLDQLVKEIEGFERDFLQMIKQIKISTMKHVKEAKQSFQTAFFEQQKTKLNNDFSYANVMYALESIYKFKGLKYDNLDYPHFKTSMLLQRMKEVNFSHKTRCLEQLEEWKKYLQGIHPNLNKTFNRATATFMFKSPSEQKIFSYYLRSLQYMVADHGRKLYRMDTKQQLPVAVVEKCLDEEGIKFRVNKIGPRGVSIGCGILRQMQHNKFDKCYQKGFFLHSKKILFSSKNRLDGIFGYSEGDVLSLHRKDHKIHFYKMNGKKVSQGFHVTLYPYQSEEHPSIHEKYYPAVFLEDKTAQIEILP